MADHRKIAEEARDALNQKDFDRFKSLHDPSGEFKGPNGQTESLDTHVEQTRRIFEALPDAKLTITRIISEGNTFVIEQYVEGTHTATLRQLQGPEIPATGKPVKLDVLVIVEEADGKIRRAHVKADRMQLLEQIGALPQPAPAGR